jgi:hypothetical protein
MTGIMAGATTRIGDVWDSTVDAARGRAGVIAPIALLGFFLPGVVQSAVALFGDPNSVATALLTGLIGIATLVIAIWAQLAIIGIATDPATTRAEASREAWRRLPPLLGLSLLIGLALIVAMIPFGIAGAMSGIDYQAMAQAQAGSPPDLSGVSTGAILFAFFYLVALIVLLVWVGTRLILLSPVILNERLGVGAFRRAFALTRGLTLKLIGVLILSTIVVLVATFAVQTAVFLLVRLPLGESGLGVATFVGAIAGGLVTTAVTALVCVFTARLYVARAGAPVRPMHEDLTPAP